MKSRGKKEKKQSMKHKESYRSMACYWETVRELSKSTKVDSLAWSLPWNSGGQFSLNYTFLNGSQTTEHSESATVDSCWEVMSVSTTLNMHKFKLSACTGWYRWNCLVPLLCGLVIMSYKRSCDVQPLASVKRRSTSTTCSMATNGGGGVDSFTESQGQL